MNYDAVFEKINKLELKYQACLLALRKEKTMIKHTRSALKNTKEAQQTAQCVAESIQQMAHSKIANVVTRCLCTVFEEPYKFNIIFEKKRGKTEARLVFIRKGVEVDPLTASGGGVIDVAAFALRLSCLMLNQPPVRKTIVLDEPFKFVSVVYRDNIKAMMEQLSKDLGIQFIMVTHMDELQTGKVKELKA